MVTSAVRAPRRSSSALVATVMPCANAVTSPASTASSARITPSDWSSGVLGTLPVVHAGPVEGHEVRERPADIDADSDHRAPH